MNNESVSGIRTAGWLAMIGKVLMLTMIISTFVYQGWYNPNMAQAAVTEAQSFPNTPTISGTTSASVSGSYSVNAGSNRLLVVAVSSSFNGAPSSQSVTASWGGQALTQMVVSDVAQRRFVWIGYLKEAGITAASGTTLQVTLANNTSLQGTETYAAVLAGVDQVSTVNGTYSVYINNTAAVMNFGTGLAVQTGGFSLFGVSVNQSVAPTQSGDTGYTLTTLDQIAATADRAFTGAKAFALAGTANPTLTYGANIRGGIAAATINPSASDATKPSVTAFAATTPHTANRNIPITSFTASDNVAVTGYLITTSSTPPAAGDAGWQGTAPATYSVGADGTFTLYPWAKDAAGNVSDAYGSPVTVVVDTVGPTVSSTVPTNGATGITVNSTVTINWSENVNCATVTAGTSVTISPAPATWTRTSCSGSQAVFTPMGQANSTGYTVTATTVVTDANGKAMASNATFNYTTAAAGPPPDAPTGILLSGMQSGGPTIAWNTVSGATTYNVYRSTDGSNWGSTIGGVGTPTTSYTDTAAPKSNTLYFWTVTATNANGESTQPAGVSGRTALYNGYNMVSAPYNTSGQVPVAAFGAWANWAWIWNSSSNVDPDNSGTYITPLEVTPGQGMFIWAYNNSTVLNASGSANPASVAVTLVPGWNMVSNHTLANMSNIGANWMVDGSTPLTTAVSNSTINGALSWWDGVQYQTLLISGNPAIEPWKAYFILNQTGVNHTLTIQ
ncbi:MAG: Ig-like domain-containing protein [Nitrospirota bacterium]